MKIYLINLDRNPERLAHMRKQLNGVAFERIGAVERLERSADDARPQPLRAGLPGKPQARLASIPEWPRSPRLLSGG